jgi:hypothetical protein
MTKAWLEIPYGLRHDAGMNAIFLQRCWPFSALKYTFIFVIIVLVSTGCSQNQTVVRIDYSPALVTTRLIPTASGQMQIGRIDVKDSRIDAFLKEKPGDPRFLVHKKNGYFRDTYGEYVVDRPIGDYIRQSLLHNLPLVGVSITDSSSLSLQADILDIRHVLIPGMFSAIRNDVAMLVRFDLVDTATSTSLWHSEFESASPIQSSPFFTGNDITRAFFSAVDGLAFKVISSKNLHDTLLSVQANHLSRAAPH